MPNTRTPRAATQHYVNKALGELAFPATKQDIINKAGMALIPLSTDRSETLETLVGNMMPETYSCAAAFCCALSVSLLTSG